MKNFIFGIAMVAFAAIANAQVGPSQAPTTITAGSGVSISPASPCHGKCTISATGSGGSVTNMSVVHANGFNGSVATSTTTPAVTITTDVTGITKGNGTALSAATAGTDYLTPSGSGSALTGITAGQVSGLAASATTDTTNAGNISTGTLAGARLPALLGQICETWDSNYTVIANTFEFPIPWATYTVTGMSYATGGTTTPSFVASAYINGSGITSLTSKTVNSSSNTNVSATGANTGVVNDQITIIVTSPSGSPAQAYVCLQVTHSQP